MNIQWEPIHRDLVLSILKPVLSQTFAFGSRTTGNARELSDLDLVIKGTVSRDLIMGLRHSLEESNLPYKVDLILWDQIEPSFQHAIASQLVPIA